MERHGCYRGCYSCVAVVSLEDTQYCMSRVGISVRWINNINSLLLPVTKNVETTVPMHSFMLHCSSHKPTGWDFTVPFLLVWVVGRKSLVHMPSTVLLANILAR